MSTRPPLGSAIERNANVEMERPSLDGVPPAPPPAGVAIRGYRPGDERAWTRIQAAADEYNEITPSLFGRAFGADPAALEARVLFAVDARGEAVGTAAAWWGDGPDDPRGRVHWVAVAPERQRAGIGRALVAAVCERMRELGHRRTFLHTSAARLPAIALYRSFGFRPIVNGDEDRAAWAEIDAALERGTGAAGGEGD